MCVCEGEEGNMINGYRTSRRYDTGPRRDQWYDRSDWGHMRSVYWTEKCLMYPDWGGPDQ